MATEGHRPERRKPDGLTSLNKASGTGGISSRVPVEITKYLEIEEGDRLAWWKEIDPRTKDKIVIVKRVRVKL